MAPVGMPVSAPSGRQSHPGFSGRQQQDDAHTGVVKSLWRAKSGPGASDQAPEHSVRFGPANGAQAPEHSLRFAQANGACRTEDEGSPVATPRVDVSPPSEAAALAGGLSVTKSSFSYASSTFLRERSRHFMDGLKWFKQANVSLYLRLQRNDDAFFVLGPANPLRLWLQQLVDHRWFTRISMAIVLLNLVALGAYDPTCDHECRKTSNRAKAEAWADNFFTVAFSVEILLQALARCFVFGPSAYMHSAWSWIDVACVASSATIYIPGDKDNVQGMRAFRALRPLRTLSVSPGMQLLVDTLVQSLPLLVNVVVLIVWILLVFGIMGVELFQGATRGRCVDAAGNQATELAVDQVCRDIHGPPGSYSCPAPYTCSATFDAPNLGRSSFDNFGFAVLDILQTITLESWTSGQMYYFLDGAGDWSTVPYYVSLIMAGNFFALNLLTAIISAKFAQLQERQDVNQMTRDRQLSGQLEGMGWRDRLKFWLSRRVSLMRRPTMRSEMGPWRQKVRTFVNRRAFNNVVTLVIVVNTFIMALYHAGMSDRLTNVLETINMVLTVAFALEMVLKHIALGIAGYWTEWFNVTDGLIVISSVIDLIVSSLGHGRSGLSALRTFRLLRVVRSLKLLRQFPGLNKLLKMILKGFKDLKDFMVIIVLFMYIFCVLGMQLFGGSPAYSPDVTQTWRKNFNTIWSAFYVVFEILTASNWHNMMWDGMNARGDWACSYFLLWIFVGPMVLLTLFLAILINNFQEVDSDTQSATPASVSGADSRKTSLDIHHNQVVPVTDLDGHLLSMATCDVERQLKMARDANMLPTSSAFAKRVLFNSATNENDSVMKMRKWLVSIDMTYGVKNVEHVSRLMEQEEAIKARMKAVTPASQTTRLWKGLRKASDFLNHVTNGAIALEASSLPANPRSRRASIPQPASTGIQSARYPAASADNWKAPNTTIAVTAQPSPQDQARDAPGDTITSESSASAGDGSLQAGNAAPGEQLTDAHSKPEGEDSNIQPSVDAAEGTAGQPPAEPAPRRPASACGHVAVALPRLSDTSAPPSSGAPKGPARVLMHSAPNNHGSSKTPARSSGHSPSMSKAQHGSRSSSGSTGQPASPRPVAESAATLGGELRPESAADLGLTLSQSMSLSAEQAAQWELAVWLRRLSTARSMSEEAEACFERNMHSTHSVMPLSRSGSFLADPDHEPLILTDPRWGMEPEGQPWIHAPSSQLRDHVSIELPAYHLTRSRGESQDGGGQALHHSLDMTALAGPVTGFMQSRPPPAAPCVSPETQELMDRLWIDAQYSAAQQRALLPGPVAEAGASSAAAEAMQPGGLGEPNLAESSQADTSQTASEDPMARNAFLAPSDKRLEHTVSWALDSEGGGSGANEQHPGQSSIAHYSSLDAHMRDSSPAPNPQLGRLKRTGSSGSPGSGMQRQPSMSGGTPRRTYSLQRPDIPHLHRALFCLQPNNPIRRFAAAIVTSSLFEGMIILMILISSILLAANKPSTSPASTLARFTGVCDQIFTYVFLTELVLKVISLGLVMHPGAYLRISWNQLDCIIVVTSMVSLYNNNPALASFKTLRLMRALRPLRLISRFKGMMIVVEALLRSLPSVANVVAFGMFEFLIFSILGVQLFAGKLYFCNQAAINGVTVVHRDQCVPGTFICTAADNCPNLGQETERQWQNNFFTFDNVGEGMLSLFIVSTLDNYMDVITYHLMDAVGVDMQPVLNYNPWAGVFIVAFVFVGAFFWVNLMVGTVIDHYSNLVNEMGGNVMLTAGQKRWMDVLKLKESRKRTLDESLRPKARMRLAAWRIISHPFFEPLIMTAIMANILAMAMPYWGQSPTYGKALDWIQNAFTIFFAIEAVLKMAALGPRAYFTNRWNWLDITIVLSSSVDMIPGVNIGIGTTIIRVLRIGRMFRLVQNSRHLRTLFNTLLSSGPAILNVGSLLFLLMFVYAVLGMDLFGDPKAPLASVAHNNFNDFGVALLTLFRAFTSDAWNETLQEAGGCTTLWVKNSCNIRKSIVSAIYFISFMVMAAYIMINLVIAVILDKFVEQASAEGLFRDNGFWEVLQKQMVLERFLRRLKLKVVEYRAAHSGKKGKMRKKSIFNPQMFNPQLIAEKLAGPRMPIY